MALYRENSHQNAVRRTLVVVARWRTGAGQGTRRDLYHKEQLEDDHSDR